MPGAREEVRRFERLPVIIGRAPACDLVLRDESRFISSNHAVISLVDGQPCIRDTSANGVFLNGAADPIGRGNEAPLRDRDTLEVGDYVLTVGLADAANAGSGASGAAAFDDDPFAALVGDDHHVPPSPVPPLAGRAAGGPAPADDPFDPFRGGEPDWSTPDAPSARGGSADADWADWPDAPGASSPAAGAASRGSAADAHPVAPARARRESGPGGHAPLDARGHSREADGHPARRAPSPASSGAAGKASAIGAPSDALAEALLLQCVEGLMALLRSRSEVKQAMRTDVTALAGTSNNPLKFSRDGREALGRLLDPAHAGEYLDPETALAQAIDDLALHQVAMLDGMKGAVGALLERFDPERLAESLTADHPIASTIPLTRDAKLWERFGERYRSIGESARGDFSAVFGREFRKAYEARVRELGREPDLW